MPFDGQAADLFGNSSVLLTQRDMSNDENLKDAAFELERALDDHQLARWAQRWGKALIAAIRDPEVDESELEEARDAANNAEKYSDGLSDAIRTFVSDFDKLATDLPDETANRINDLVGKLEGAL